MRHLDHNDYDHRGPDRSGLDPDGISDDSGMGTRPLDGPPTRRVLAWSTGGPTVGALLR